MNPLLIIGIVFLCLMDEDFALAGIFFILAGLMMK